MSFGRSLPSVLSRHLTRLREEGVRKAAKHAVNRRIEAAAALVRKPLRRLFPYHYRLENIADTWNEAFSAYQPTSYIGEAMLFRASTGLVAGMEGGRFNGWQRLILGNIEVNECPGDHNSMCDQPHVRVLARRLRSYLQRQVRDNMVRDADPSPESQRPRTAQTHPVHAVAS